MTATAAPTASVDTPDAPARRGGAKDWAVLVVACVLLKAVQKAVRLALGATHVIRLSGWHATVAGFALTNVCEVVTIAALLLLGGMTIHQACAPMESSPRTAPWSDIPVLGRVRPDNRDAWVAFALVVTVAWDMAARSVVSWASGDQHLVQATATSLASMPAWATLLESCVLAPVLEEVLFRGVILTLARRVMGTWPAIVVSATAFAAYHFQGWTPSGAWILVSVAGAGVAYGALRTFLGIRTSMAAHALHNLIP